MMKGNINKSFSHVYPFKLALEELFKPPLWQRVADPLAMECSLSIGGKEIYLFLTWLYTTKVSLKLFVPVWACINVKSLSIKKILP